MTSALRRSDATPAEIELYTAGSCHVLATCLHRMRGWSFLVATRPDRIAWQDPADADNFIPEVVHVYAVDGDGNAWDALGVRPAQEIDRELRERHPDVAEISIEEIHSESAMRRTYVTAPDDGDIDRPLHSLEESDIVEAEAFAARALRSLLPAAGAAP